MINKIKKIALDLKEFFSLTKKNIIKIEINARKIEIMI